MVSYYAHGNSGSNSKLSASIFSGGLAHNDENLYEVSLNLEYGWVEYHELGSVFSVIDRMPGSTASQIAAFYKRNPDSISSVSCQRITSGFLVRGAYSTQKLEKLEASAEIGSSSIVTVKGNYRKSVEQSEAYTVPGFVHCYNLSGGSIEVFEAARERRLYTILEKPTPFTHRDLDEALKLYSLQPISSDKLNSLVSSVLNLTDRKQAMLAVVKTLESQHNGTQPSDANSMDKDNILNLKRSVGQYDYSQEEIRRAPAH